MNRLSKNLAWTLCLAAIGLLMAACRAVPISPEEAEARWQTSAHADAEARAFSRWNEDDPAEIPESCAKCHSTNGYHDYLGLDGSPAGEVNAPAPVGTTVECEACHNDLSGEKHTSLMPSGIELNGLGSNSFCMDCHQGRQSTTSVNAAIEGLEPDTVDPDLGFLNIHNKAVAATQYGRLARGGYEYEGKQYAGRYAHTPEFDTCIACHDPHALEVDSQSCSACHLGAVTREDRLNIRVVAVDYDGDGDIKEGLAAEIDSLRAHLLTAIQLYAAGLDDGYFITYEPQNPYFFDDQGEAYAPWSPRLLQAAYNYRYTTVEPGGFAHNGAYHIQLLYDSLEDLGANVSTFTRPEAP